jgi:hypothetical protein
MRILPDAHDVSELHADSVSWMKHLPATRTFETAQGSLLLCHGLRENDMAMLKHDDYGYALNANEALERLLYESNFRYIY